MAFVLPALPYTANALEPHIDARTMELHHGKHHSAYVTKLNKAIEKIGAGDVGLDQLCRNISRYPRAVRNNGGGHWNHSMFWTVLAPNAGGKPEGELARAIDSAFGGFEEFRKKFSDAAKNCFGSGWAWLIKDEGGVLKVTSTPNQDNPLMDVVKERGTPLLVLDVWEHAYYLKYQYRRPDYIDAFWNIVNWKEAARRYAA